jgi:hypothetical protein
VSQIDVSVIIVNYNVKSFAEQCLHSVNAAIGNLSVEVFLIDNGSTDGSVEFLKTRFPTFEIIDNRENIGFGRANNIGLKRSQGKYLLILNPDTLIAEDTLQNLSDYLDAHPEVGAAGPKILTREGAFDVTSKRGFPTPWVAFSRLSGLSKIFPKSPIFGSYDLLYLDPDQPAEVDSLVGSCMIVRRETYLQTGGFDEDYFMYGEDIDWCFRMKQAGWQIHYAPVTKIVHFRGESVRRSNINRESAFYGAMHLFVDKHFKNRYPYGAHWLINFGIFIAGTAARIRRIWLRIFWPLVDWILIALIIAGGRWTRWGDVGLNTSVAFSIAIEATVWVFCLAGFGAYSSRRGQIRPLLWGMGLGFLINSSFTFFFKQFAYSRYVNLFALVVGTFAVWIWRTALSHLRNTIAWQRFYQRRTLIVGVGKTGKTVIEQLKADGNSPYTPVGFIDPEEKTIGSLINDIPVLGGEIDVPRLIAQEEIEEVFFAYDEVNHNRVFEIVSKISSTGKINFKIIDRDMASESDGRIPLLSLEYLSPRRFGKSIRKISTLVVKR